MRVGGAALVLAVATVALVLGIGVSARDKLMDLQNPHALLDSEKDVWFEALTESELREKWSSDDGTSVAHKIARLQRFDASVMVDVRLVGFDGAADGGNMDLRLSEHDLLKYLDVAGASSASVAHVLNTTPRQSHDLSLRVQHVYRVTKAPHSLTAAIAAAVTSHIDPHRAEMDVRVPVSAVDDLIRADYARHGVSYTLYLLNPPQPKRMMSSLPPNKDGTLPPDAEQRPVPIRYTYSAAPEQPPAAAGAAAASTAASPQHTCPTVVWAATQRGDRYAWIDLTAGPVAYGPQTAGDGIVTEFSLPRPDRKLFLPHTTGKPSSATKAFAHDTRPDTVPVHGTPHDPSRPPMTDPVLTPAGAPAKPPAPELSDVELNVRAHELMAEVAALVRKSITALVVPAIDRFPVTYTKRIVLNVVVVHDTADNAADPISSWSAWDKRWAAARDELSALNLVGQEIVVNTHHLTFDECELCVAAYTHSVKSHTSNVMLQDGLRTQVHRYLDSSELRDWLEHFETKFWGIKADAQRGGSDASSSGSGSSGTGSGATSVRAVTAFVYDLNTPEILLLDRFHQSLSFADMAIAVQTRAPAAVVDFSCGGKPLQFDPRDTTRPLLASLLQTTWGVSPTDAYWNAFSGEVEHDYLWSTGPTPFGYFSHSKVLSFAQRDAVARHVLYSDLNHTMTELSDVLQHFASHNKEIEEVLSAHDHVTFLRRWNVFTYKLERAYHFLSVPNFNQSLFYVRSSQHDLDAMHALVHTALRQLTPAIVCKTTPMTSAWARLQTLVFIAVLCLAPVAAFILTSNTFWNSALVRRATQRFRRRKHIE